MLFTSRFTRQAFARNIGLLSLKEQERICSSKVAIVGMGGVGGIHLITLTRTGVGTFHIADFDHFEIENFNRQYGANTSTIGREKVEVMESCALEINPQLRIVKFPAGITSSNIDQFLEKVDLVVDGLDAFAISTRRLLFAKARDRGIPVITAGPIGFGASVIVFTEHSPSFDEYMDIHDSMTESECLAAFFAGLTPSSSYVRYIDKRYVSATARRGPSLDLACNLCAGFTAAEAIKLITGLGKIYPAPYSLRIDPYLNECKRRYLFFNNRGPIQRLRRRMIEKALRQETGRPAPLPHLPAEPIKDGKLTREALDVIVAAGTLAISGDNSQHWKFLWNEEELILRGNKESGEFFYSVNGEVQFISYGAVIENIDLAARAMGLETALTYSNLEDVQGEIVRIRFTEGASHDTPLYPYLYERRTNRKNYTRTAIKREDIAELDSELAYNQNVKLCWFTDRRSRKSIESIIFSSEKILWENEHYHGDLFKWLRPNQSSPDGLTPETLGISRYEYYALRLMKSWRLVSFLNNFMFSSLTARTGLRWARNCGGFCMVRYKGNSAADFINAGRAIERFWIKANSLGLSVQPMHISVNIYHRMKYADGAGLAARHMRQARKICDEWEKLIPDSGEWCNVMLFRLGYAKHSTPMSNRRKAELLSDLNSENVTD